MSTEHFENNRHLLRLWAEENLHRAQATAFESFAESFADTLDERFDHELRSMPGHELTPWLPFALDFLHDMLTETVSAVEEDL